MIRNQNNYLHILALLLFIVTVITHSCQCEEEMKWKALIVYKLGDCYPDNEILERHDSFYISLVIGFKDSIMNLVCIHPNDAWYGGNHYFQLKNGEKVFIREIIVESDLEPNKLFVFDTAFKTKNVANNFAQFISEQRLIKLDQGREKIISKSQNFMTKIR